MTRNERSLDRQTRHSAFVRARIERAIAEARTELEELAAVRRKLAYFKQSMLERRNIMDKIAAHQAHLRALRRKRWFEEQRPGERAPRLKRQEHYDRR